MSLIINHHIVRLEDILRITFREEQSRHGGLFCTIYVYLKTQDSHLSYYFHCINNQEIIKQIKKDVAVIFTDMFKAVYDLEDIVKTSRRRGYETVAKSSLFEKNKVEPTAQEVSDEVERLLATAK